MFFVATEIMPKFPIPGTPVRGSKTGAPLMALFDLLGRSWSMGVVWQLCEKGPVTFRTLQSLCGGVSPAVLNSRLKELRRAGLIMHSDRGYEATSLGEELYTMLKPMKTWSDKWANVIHDH
jgi:DNA-binding HxlR family transcriptional regulator